MSPSLAYWQAKNSRPNARTSCRAQREVVTKSFKTLSIHELPQRNAGKSILPVGPLNTRREVLAFLAVISGLGVGQHQGAAASAEDALTPAARAAEAVRRDFVDRQYYVTGNLTSELFAPDCVFKDPTVEVTGVEPYVRALQTLFDPATSRADLISLRVTSPTTLELRWRLEGSLKLGGLKIKPYTGTTVYTIGGDGKVARHEETWDISTLDAFVSTFIPGFGAPPAPPVNPTST